MKTQFENILRQLEQKWDALDERALRAQSFEDIEEFRLARAQQGSISMSAMLIFKEARSGGIELGFEDFLSKISEKTNIRSVRG